MSRRMTSGSSLRASSSPSWGPAAVAHWYPSYSRIIRRDLRMSSSSSTTRIRGFMAGNSSAKRKRGLEFRPPPRNGSSVLCSAALRLDAVRAPWRPCVGASFLGGGDHHESGGVRGRVDDAEEDLASGL